MTTRPRLRLTAIFLLGVGVTAVMLGALGRISHSGESTRPSSARLREAPPPAPASEVHSQFLARPMTG
jgi:hypothetical protein